MVRAPALGLAQTLSFLLDCPELMAEVAVKSRAEGGDTAALTVCAEPVAQGGIPRTSALSFSKYHSQSQNSFREPSPPTPCTPSFAHSSEWPVSQEMVVQSLFQNQHGLCPILPCQVESMSEVVFPPEEGIEIIRDEQDLWSKMLRHISGAAEQGIKKDVLVTLLGVKQLLGFSAHAAGGATVTLGTPCPSPCHVKPRETHTQWLHKLAKMYDNGRSSCATAAQTSQLHPQDSYPSAAPESQGHFSWERPL